MGIDIVTGVLGVIFCITLALVLFLRRNYGWHDKCGYPVVKPHLVLGSGPFMLHETNVIETDTKWTQMYGKIFGIYQVCDPWVYVADPEIIKQICIKDFEHFPAHSLAFQDKKYKSLDSTEGPEWKELRKAMSPVFTSGKLKGMISLMDGALDNMINYLNKVIYIGCIDYNILGLFGEMDFVNDGIRKLWDHVRRIQNERAGSGAKYGDFVDRLLEMKTSLVKSGLISEDQVTAQGMIFFLAGYDTTSRGMSSLLYFLSKNPEAYEILQEEIDSVDGEKFDHDTIAELPYVEACLKEAMRLLPAVGRNDRKCVKDWEYKGYKIKKGTKVGLLNYIIHHNPEYWPEPEVFRPERFLKENSGDIVPCSYLPFGAGPRACIGERFAMVQMKIAITKLLQNFTVEAMDSTRLEFCKGDIFSSSVEDIQLRFVPRK